ncbi:MAG: hypothetical protein H0U55_01250 [Rubrobacteraceae bacterium]|nr:hypothetical protein [Rubrobacteraceae bacterium]
MGELGPMDFFTERDRAAILGQLRMRESASRNIADYYRAARDELSSAFGAQHPVLLPREGTP